MRKSIGALIAIMMVMGLVAACAAPVDAPVTGATPAPEAGYSPAGQGRGDVEDAARPGPSEEGAPMRGGTLVFAPTSEGVGPIGLPWDLAPADFALVQPFTHGLTAQALDGSTVLTLSAGYTVGRDETRGENGLYFVEHTLHQGIYLHPHFLNPAEKVNASLIEWLAGRVLYYSAWPSGMIYVEATGEYTVRFYWDHMRNATPSMTTAWVTSREIYEYGGPELLADTPVSAGPFRVVEYVRGSHVLYERFDNYFQEGRPYLDGVHMVFLGDTLVQNIALQTEGEGRVDVVATNTAEQGGTFSDLGYTILMMPNQTIVIVPPNDDPDNPLAHPLVRQAISMAIDRHTITEALGFGIHRPTYQHIPPGFGARNPDPNYGVPGFGLARARELMAEAGFADGFHSTLLPRPGSVTASQAVALGHQLQDIGISTEIVILDAVSFTEMRRETGWDGILVCNFISWFQPEDSGRINFQHIEGLLPNWVSMVPTDRMNELIDAAFFFGDNIAEVMELSDYMLDNLHIIPLWHQGNMHIVHPRIAGTLPEDHMLVFYRLWINE
ncbi:MAG: ABC transporter substrate-binding protein [Oscillospiraceae bacterium]|nr:ABC transporter substrate-binding protein [Oscillospiraceae bacterium]